MTTLCHPQDYRKGNNFILNKFSRTKNFISFAFKIIVMETLTEDIIKWIEEHKNCDTAKLRLGSKNKETDFAILQIECRKKASKKLSKTLQSPRFIFPTSLSAEQCTSDALAEFHATLINPGDKLLDMTAGLGIDTLHFSKRASYVTSIEFNTDVADALKINCKNLNINNISVHSQDCRDFINKTNEHYNVIFIDPARRGNEGKRLYALSDCQPDIVQLIDVIRNKTDKLIIKASPMLDVAQIQKELSDITDIYAIGTRQECKELVIIIDFNTDSSTPLYHCVTIDNDKFSDFTFKQDFEYSAMPKFGIPEASNYIYEPSPSVMKMQPVKFLSEKYDLYKLHPNTHLYFSDKHIPDFPGDCYIINNIYPFSSKIIKTLSKEHPSANIAVRNFILSADELRKRLKMKENDNVRLYGVTANGENRLLIISQKI